MAKIKKICLIFALALIMMCIFFGSKVYAAFSCNVSLSSVAVNEGEEFWMTMNVSNIQGANGLLAIGGVLDYRRDELELLDREGRNGCDITLNRGTGKFSLDRESYLTGGGNVAAFKFKALKSGSFNVTIRNIEATNRVEEINPNNAYGTVRVGSAVAPTPTPTPVPTPNPTQTPPTTDNPNGNQGGQAGNQGGTTSGNQGNSGQTSRPSGGNNNTNKPQSNENQTPENPEATPEVTPEVTPTPNPTPTLKSDNEEDKEAVKLIQAEENNKQGLIYILIALVIIIVVIIIILIIWARVRNKNIRKLEKGK